jgi:hypothetical protein
LNVLENLEFIELAASYCPAILVSISLNVVIDRIVYENSDAVPAALSGKLSEFGFHLVIVLQANHDIGVDQEFERAHLLKFQQVLHVRIETTEEV